MKTALVTGGTRGIGLSTAQKFIDQGWNVYITTRKQENLDTVLSENSQLKGFVARADDLAAATETCKKIIDESGSLDILINNAGTNPSGGSLLDVDLSAVQKTWDVNLMGPLIWTREAVKAGLKESVMNVCSVGGIKPSHYMGAYNISKAADIMLVKNYALEFGQYNIRTNAIAPGLFKTDFAKALWENPEILKQSTATCPMKRIGEPDEIGGAAVFLASQAGSFVNGHTLVIDGGTVV